jgi:hypothetical protein
MKAGAAVGLGCSEVFADLPGGRGCSPCGALALSSFLSLPSFLSLLPSHPIFHFYFLFTISVIFLYMEKQGRTLKVHKVFVNN